MKLLNYTTRYLAVILLVIIGFWSVIFYNRMVYIFNEEIVEGLINQKQLIIKKAQTDSSILKQQTIAEGNFNVNEISSSTAHNYREVFIDTVLYMPSEDENEPFKLLKTSFEMHGRYYELNIASSTLGEADIVKELFYNLLWLYIALVLSILIINNFLLKKAWKPFYELLQKLDNFSLDNSSNLPVIPTKIQEFFLLNKSVQKMVAHNAGIYNKQKQFIENASHELQTPIAISLNKLETLANADGMDENGLRLLGDAIYNLERLTRLNKSLLLLSKIDNNQYQEILEVQLNTVVQKAVDDFNDQLEYRNIRLDIESEAICMLKINPELASILITNLLKNAIVHNLDNGSIKITINCKQLQIENTGKSVALNQEKIFSRFYKESQSSTSTGLGLAIVKAIVDMYNYTINYRFDTVHIVTISFLSK